MTPVQSLFSLVFRRPRYVRLAASHITLARRCCFEFPYGFSSKRETARSLFWKVWNVGACSDLLVLFHCLRTLLCRIEFSSLSLHLCARSQAVFGGIHPVKASIYKNDTINDNRYAIVVFQCVLPRIKFSLASRLKFSWKDVWNCLWL